MSAPSLPNIQIAESVKLGEGVRIFGFANLYGCEIGDGTKIGTFVEIQKGAKVGKRCKISSHTFICEGVTIEDNVFIGHGVTFINDSYPRATTMTGDLQTENDAMRLRAAGGTAIQITTGSACHLDAHMVMHALEKLDLDALDVLFIENVGNLVCPTLFDLGEDARVALWSVPEGEDKPVKYPQIFQSATLTVIRLLRIFLSHCTPLANIFPQAATSLRMRRSLRKTKRSSRSWRRCKSRRLSPHRCRRRSQRSRAPRISQPTSPASLSPLLPHSSHRPTAPSLSAQASMTARWSTL